MCTHHVNAISCHDVWELIPDSQGFVLPAQYIQWRGERRGEGERAAGRTGSAIRRGASPRRGTSPLRHACGPAAPAGQHCMPRAGPPASRLSLHAHVLPFSARHRSVGPDRRTSADAISCTTICSRQRRVDCGRSGRCHVQTHMHRKLPVKMGLRASQGPPVELQSLDARAVSTKQSLSKPPELDQRIQCEQTRTSLPLKQAIRPGGIVACTCTTGFRRQAYSHNGTACQMCRHPCDEAFRTTRCGSSTRKVKLFRTQHSTGSSIEDMVCTMCAVHRSMWPRQDQEFTVRF